MSLEPIIKRSYRTTGIKELDSLIYGWPKRGLSLVYGSQKAGKTSLAMQAALHVAAEGSQVLYLDTESGGAGELRLYSMAAALGLSEADIPRTTSMIHIYKANEVSEQHRIITDDWNTYRKTNDVGLYVVDSVAWLYHQRVMNAPPEHVGSVAREVMGKLEMQTKTLLGYAADSGASIIYTSWSASKAKKAFEEHQRREMMKTARRGVVDVRDIDVVLGTYGEDYIGGRFIGYMSKVIARIWRLQGDLRFFVVEAHRERPDGIGIYMHIGAAGLQPMPNSQPVRVEQEMIQKLVKEEEAVVADTDGSGGSGQAAGRRMGSRKN